MKRSLRITGSVLLVVVQILVVCFLVDYFFKIYEKDHLFSYVSKDAPSYSLGPMLLNDHGGPLPKKKPDDEYRILVFGDSFSYAVTQAQYSFSAVLERRLNAAGLNRHVRVVNLGFPSISFPEYLERFYFWSQALEYDAVIFNVYLGNDFNDVRNTPYDPKAFAAALEEICARGEACGLYTLVPHQFYFRFLDFVKARILMQLETMKVDAAAKAAPTDGKAAAPAQPATSPTPVVAGTDQAVVPKIAIAGDGSAAFPLPQNAAGQAVASAGDPRYQSLLPLSAEQMASEMRSHLKPFVRETMFAYKNNLPWYQLFLATVAKVQASGKPVLVMLSPPLCAVSPTVGRQAALDLDVDPAAIDPALPERITRELARNVGLPQETILDFTPCLGEKTPTGETTYTGVDTHWSVAGNAWVGDLLTETLLARWFGRSSATGPACAPAATPAFEPIPSGLAPPAASQMPLATSIVTGCPGR